MTEVLFAGGMADNEILEFPDFTLLPDFYIMHSADGTRAEIYELEYAPDLEPACIYRYVGMAPADLEGVL